MARISEDGSCPKCAKPDDHLLCQARLQEIEEELRAMGASEDYCRQYFQLDGGICERVLRGQCKKHRYDRTPLPDGILCSEEFGQQAAFLRSQVAEIKTERNRLFQELDRLGVDDPSLSDDAKQERQRTICELRNEQNHLFMQLHALMGERLLLLERDPVDATAWRRKVTDLLSEKIDVLERLKLGPSLAGLLSSRDEPRPLTPPIDEPRRLSSFEPCLLSDPC